MQHKYLVNEIARFFNVTRDTIRYYDKLGIIKPNINKENKYRYYSREDLISFSYVFLLKKLGLHLKSIEALLNHSSLETSVSILNNRKKEIEDALNELNRTKDMIDDYGKYLVNVYGNMNEINIVNNIFILYQIINQDVHTFNMITKQLEGLQLNKIPLFTFCFEKEAFLSNQFNSVMDSRYYSKFAMSIKVEEKDILNEEKLHEFLIFKSEKCLFTTIKFHTNKDYSAADRLRNYIKENNLIVDGMVLYRAISFRNNIIDNQDYYEVYIPLK